MKREKIVHLAFCEKCLTAKELTNHVLITYTVNLKVVGFYCEKEGCEHLNKIPAYMYSIVDELIETLEKVNIENKTSTPKIKRKFSPYQNKINEA